MMSCKAVFLDRDDTLINDPGYISDPLQVELLPGASKALIDIQKMGYKTVVVSNQSAVARGIVTENTLDHIHTRLRELLGRQNAYLDAIYYCPYHPEGSVPEYRKESELRKPNPGMLLKAAKEMDIDLESSWMVGDSYRDIAAGKKAGCRTILISSSVHPVVKAQNDPEPDHKAVNIVEAVNIIKMFNRQSHVSATAARYRAATSIDHTDKRANPRDDDVVKLRHEQDDNDIIANWHPEEEAQQHVAAQTETQTPPQTKTQDQTQTDTYEPDLSSPMEQVTEQIEEIKLFAESVISNTEKQAQQYTLPEVDNSHHKKTHRILDDIHTTLKRIQRQELFSEFSVFRLAAWSLQIVSIGLVLLSVVFLLDAEKHISNVYTTLAYAAISQLMVIAFCLMSGRK